MTDRQLLDYIRKLMRAPGAVQAIRVAAGLKQSDVAAMVGCSRFAISRYEGGSRRYGRDTLVLRYARVLLNLAAQSADGPINLGPPVPSKSG